MLFILRHGERADDGGPNKSIELEYDPHLTQYGKEQSVAAGATVRDMIDQSYKKGILKTKNPKLVFVSSPYLRCIQTAEYMIKAFNQENIYKGQIFLDDGISEFLGEVFFDFSPLDKLHSRTKSAQEFKKYCKYPIKDGLIGDKVHSGNPKFPEVQGDFFEGLKESYHRLKSHFLEELNKENDKVLIIVSHGFGVRAMMGFTGNFDPNGIDYTSINQVYYEYPK